MHTKNCIVIEDDVALASQFREMLELAGLNVKVFHSAEEFLLSDQKATAVTPHIFLIDLHLPCLAGTDLVKVIRYKDKISPIFIITGESPDTALEKCLSAGADDFLLKPYNPDHLLLKISNARSKLRFLLGSMMDFGVKFVSEARLISRDGVKVKLTNREYAIAECLLRSPELIHSREALVREIGDREITDRTVDVHVSSLRKKLPAIRLEIETIRGRGYRIKGLEAMAEAI